MATHSTPRMAMEQLPEGYKFCKVWLESGGSSRTGESLGHRIITERSPRVMRSMTTPVVGHQYPIA